MRIGRTAVRPYTPRPLCGRGAGGEGEQAWLPANSEPKRCTLIPIAKPKFTKTAVDDPLLQVPPCSQGEPSRHASRGSPREAGGT